MSLDFSVDVILEAALRPYDALGIWLKITWNHPRQAWKTEINGRGDPVR
jgi:hypothetical protein